MSGPDFSFSVGDVLEIKYRANDLKAVIIVDRILSDSRVEYTQVLPHDNANHTGMVYGSDLSTVRKVGNIDVHDREDFSRFLRFYSRMRLWESMVR